MRKQKPPKRKKFRFLLDSAFASSSSFPELYKKSNLAHVVFDYHLSEQAEDKDIYGLAIQENRFVITINFKDFRRLVKKNKPGIIGIESQLTNKEIDQKVTLFIRDKDPKDYFGKAKKI
ncbi:hypothetical protein A2960_04530 [Candidatus Gottesmanbacteria bacterium RIFCSPLOWO2_01_FULL_39_12b]|uniref:DUF5615 domain-containing protein n=1 Tax=Candidatus Gottesmanbacteria bacterium RIFCSPLOWO2_01_FULL_39_12b TaxID=1798388 RepID=A0A1F6ANE8_9BACT|nr:MAG: hypothetical protein A2960_04530 [Candidatus Gottesmanbacteria bacterium RIFCSPLOWO2_01_FULL_39_12b]